MSSSTQTSRPTFPLSHSQQDLTKFHKEERLCPYCGYAEEVTIWDAVDAETDPDLKEKLLRKQLQVLDCSNCGRHFLLAEALLYADPGAKALFYLQPALAEAIQSDDNSQSSWQDRQLKLQQLTAEGTLEMGTELEGWHLRLFLTTNDLMEAIHLLDNGLDDRVMAVVKLALQARLQSEENKEVLSLHFLSASEERLLFVAEYPSVEDEEGRLLPNREELEISPELYFNAHDLLQDRLPAEDGWLLVDTLSARSWIE